MHLFYKTNPYIETCERNESEKMEVNILFFIKIVQEREFISITARGGGASNVIHFDRIFRCSIIIFLILSEQIYNIEINCNLI